MGLAARVAVGLGGRQPPSKTVVPIDHYRAQLLACCTTWRLEGEFKRRLRAGGLAGFGSKSSGGLGGLNPSSETDVPIDPLQGTTFWLLHDAAARRRIEVPTSRGGVACIGRKISGVSGGDRPPAKR